MIFTTSGVQKKQDATTVGRASSGSWQFASGFSYQRHAASLSGEGNLENIGACEHGVVEPSKLFNWTYCARLVLISTTSNVH
jgi:hypothetical protein